jgi:hypothetical protein
MTMTMTNAEILERDTFRWLGLTFTGHRVVKSALVIIYTHVEIFGVEYGYMMFDWETGILYFSNDNSILDEETSISDWLNAADWYIVENLLNSGYTP